MFQQTPLRREYLPRTLTSVLGGVFVAVLILVTVSVALLAPQKAAAATNNTLNFQARLENATGAIAKDGNYNVEFKLYNVSSGGSALWTETYRNSASQGITVKNGYLSTNLGSITAFPGTINWDQDLWITLNVAGNSTSDCGAPFTTPYGSNVCLPDGEMTPRLKLTAVPYAFKAGQLATYNAVSGFTSTLQLLQPTVGSQVFQVPDQGAAGTYTLCVQGSVSCVASGSGNYIQNSAGGPQVANFNIQSAAAGSIAANIQGASGQTADLLDVFAGSVGLSVGATGAVKVSSLSGNSFIVANNLNQPIISVNSSLNSLQRVSIITRAAANVGLTISSVTGQTADLAQLQDTNGNVYSGIGANGNFYTNGTTNTFTGLTYPSGLGVATAGTAGSTTYGYRVSALNSQGETIAAPEVTIATGNATLNASNYNVITWNSVPGATSYKVYGRTAGAELFMASVTSTGAATYTYNDQGGVTPSGALPTGSGFGSVLTVQGGNNNGSNPTFVVKNNIGQGIFTAGGSFNGASINGALVVDNSNSSSLSALRITNALGTTVGGYLQAAAGQSADLFQFKASDGTTILSKFDASGNIYGPSFDAVSGALAVGTTNATAINLNQTTVIASGKNLVFASSGSSISVTSASTAGSLTIQGQTATTAGAAGGNLVLQGGTPGSGGSYGNIIIANSGGKLAVGTSTANNLLSVGALITVDNSAQVAVVSGGDTKKGIVIQGNSGTQSADLLEAQSSSGSILFRVGATGTIGSGDRTSVGNTNDVLLSSGNASSGNAGSVSIDSGTATGGTTGSVSIGSASASSITLGRTSGTTNITTSFYGNAIFKPNADNTTAFQIQNAASGTSLFTVDTQNAQISTALSSVNVGGIAAPATPAVVAGANTGGTLSGSSSTTYYYKISALGSAGESLGSKEVSINGAGFTKLSTPAAPTVSTTATTGTLASNTVYYYKITALTPNGETDASAEASQNTGAAGTALSLSWTAVTGATSYNVYRGTASGLENVYYNSATNSYTDTNAASTAGTAPYLNTATTNTNNATISWSAVTGATSYRVYRGTSAGGENTYFTSVGSPYTDTGSAGTAGSVLASATYGNVSVTGDINTSSNIKTGGTSRIDNLGNLQNINSLQQTNSSASSYLMGALGLGTANPQTAAALTIANGSWISAVDASGTGYINMFQVNSSNQIQVGAALNFDGSIVLPTNGGQMTLVDLGIDSTATVGTKESYSLRVGSANAMTIYGEADGAGNAQNIRISIGSNINPTHTLDVGGDISATSTIAGTGQVSVQDAATQTKGIRLRTTGTYLDLEATGSSYLYLTMNNGANYNGTSSTQMIFTNGGPTYLYPGLVIKPTSTSAVPLTITPVSGSTAASLQFNNQSGAAAAVIDNTGNFFAATQFDTYTSTTLYLGPVVANAIQLGRTGGATNIGTTVMGTALFKPNTDAANIFQIQSAGGTNKLLSVDSSANRVFIGNSAGDTVGVSLVVDNKTNSGDPTGTNGAIYYNAGGTGGNGKFRCYEAGTWKNCIGMSDIVARRWGYASIAGTTSNAFTASGTLSTTQLSASVTDATHTVTSNPQAESNYINFATVATNGTNVGFGAGGPVATATQARYLPRLTTRISTDGNANTFRGWIALTDSTLMSTNPPTSSTAIASNYIGVGISTTGAFICSSGDGVNGSGTSMGVSVANSSYYDVVVDYTSGSLVCSVSVNGGAWTSVTQSANLPTASTNLGIQESIKTTSAAIRTFNVSYLYLDSN